MEIYVNNKNMCYSDGIPFMPRANSSASGSMTETSLLESLTVRDYTDEDFNTIKLWWQVQRKDSLHKAFLSTTGIVILKDGKPVVVGFLYFTNSVRCFGDYIIASPEIQGEERSTIIDLLIDVMTAVAANKGYKFIEACVRNRSFKKRCKNKGFIDLGEISYLGRELWAV